MQVKIRRKAKDRWTQADKLLAQFAIDFASDKLGIWACGEDLEVILRGDYECGSYGDCIDLDNRIVLRIAKKEHWLKTLFHELEHVRQYVDDELELEFGYSVWKGKLYNLEEVEYWDQPWEVKARKMEEKLYREFRKYILTLSA